MAAVSFDGQSILMDGRRVWLASGTVDYARIPGELWAARLRCVRNLGLNCIETPIVWALHEPRPGHTTFEGDLDLVRFIRTAAQHELKVILRIGPYVGGGRELGGIPPWLLHETDRRPRSGTPALLQAFARFLGRLSDQVVDLQASRSTKKRSGPIVMIQLEHEWTCGDREQAASYLDELARYLRESGFDVPILGANNLFHMVEGEVSAWTGEDHLHAHLRQLRGIKPDQPAFAAHLSTGSPIAWGEREPEPPDPWHLLRRIALAQSVPAQWNLDSACSGTNFAWNAGSLPGPEPRFLTHTHAPHAPIDEVGSKGPAWRGVRRIAHFASHFQRIHCGLDPAQLSVAVSPDTDVSAARPSSQAVSCGVSVIECRGTQGNVVYVFGDPTGPDDQTVPLILGDGSQLRICLGEQRLAWLLINAPLAPRARLDFCAFSAFALLGSVYVCFGPSGTSGWVSINGAPIEMIVPKGKEPLVQEHENITIILCNEHQIDGAIIHADTLFIGAAEINPDGDPVWEDNAAQIRIAADGTLTRSRKKPVPRTLSPHPPKLGAWSFASCGAYVDGSSDRFAHIEGPSDMLSLGVPSGYGWLRLKLNAGVTVRAVNAHFPQSADRLHFFLDGKPIGLTGVGPGTDGDSIKLGLKRSAQRLAVLIDNFGRLASGTFMGEPKGIFGHARELKTIRAGAPKVAKADPFNPLRFRSPIFGLDAADSTDARRLTWSFIHRRKSDLILRIEPIDAPTMVWANGEPIAVLADRMRTSFVLKESSLRRGKNEIQMSVVGDFDIHAATLRKSLAIFESVAVLTESAEWSFAKWEFPPASDFEPDAGSAASPNSAGVPGGLPRWCRCAFELARVEAPLMLDVKGLSKGQIFLNGRNLGRYFAATRSGKTVGPQTLHYLPEPWLRTDEPNELILFDEHGLSTAQCRLVVRTN